jgi:DNA repair protein RecO (recombination protein O)
VQPIHTEAIVLRAVSYGEADRIVTLLSESEGRIAALARSARKSQKRFAGGLEVGQVLAVDLTPKMGQQLATLTASEPVPLGGKATANTPELLAAIGYGCELALGVSHEGEAAPEQYPTLRRWLFAIHRGGVAPTSVAEIQWALMAAAGYAPQLDVCAVTGESLETMNDEGARTGYWFSPRRGGVVAARHRLAGDLLVDTGVIQLLRALACGDLTDLDTPRPTVIATETAMERFIEASLGHALKSWPVWEALR